MVAIMKHYLAFLAAVCLFENVACQSARGELIVQKVGSISSSRFCKSFRYNAEVNNLRNWLVPQECVRNVRSYFVDGEFELDFRQAVEFAREYAKNLTIQGDGLDAWVFDIDETSLSNYPYYAQHGYGSEKFDPVSFNKWVDTGNALALPTLALYKDLVAAKFSVVFLTGRPESQRAITENNLRAQGYKTWKSLILRTASNTEKTALEYKSSQRKLLISNGFRIWGNIGDQWSDITGEAAGARTFKVPDPLYYIQ